MTAAEEREVLATTDNASTDKTKKSNNKWCQIKKITQHLKVATLVHR